MLLPELEPQLAVGNLIWLKIWGCRQAENACATGNLTSFHFFQFLLREGALNMEDHLYI